MSLENFILEALAEDVGPGDYTSLSTIPADKMGAARLLVKEEGILAGVEVAREVLRITDPTMHAEFYLLDGTAVKPGDVAFVVKGPVRSILKAERLLLNLMQRMSGIATTTHKYVSAVSAYSVKILDTRKTTPLLRQFEKWAVRIGGGHNHRMGLYDMVLIKDNHVDAAGGIEQALRSAKAYLEANNLQLPIEIETRNLDEVQTALTVGIADRIMLDNFSPALMQEAVALIGDSATTEASGGITLATLEAYAATGVNELSVGALTHSVKSLDLSLKII